MWILKKINIGLNALAVFICSSDTVKVAVWFEPLTPEEEKIDEEFMGPFTQSVMPMWVENHPFLFWLMCAFASTIGKIRMAFKKKEEVKNHVDGKEKPAPTRAA